MDRQNIFGSDHEVTEDFTELLEDKKEVTEQLDVVNDEETEELIGLVTNKRVNNNYERYSGSRITTDPAEEVHINDFKRDDEDDYDEFSSIVKRRDYKGKVEINDRKEKRHGKKRKLKKWVYILVLLVLLGGGFATYKILHDKEIARKQEEDKTNLEKIKSHYSDVVKITKDTVLYEKDDKDYKEIGTIYKDAVVELEKEDIKLDTKYFHIKDLDYYVSYEDVEKGEKQETNTRYKKYLPFNINIVTKDKFTIYLDDQKLITLDKSMEFPVIINNYEDKYYVEYNDMLVNISKDDVEKTKENKNTEKKNQAKITTLAYHRVYDKGDKCTDAYVCIKKENFDKQMKYLSENNYLTLTLDELYMYLKGNLQVEKAVTITIDDGYLFTATDEILDKYGLNGTMFVISGDFVGKYERFEGLKAIDIQSHTHGMHKNYVCSGGNQGGAMLCAGKQKIVDDLKKSLESLGVSAIGFAYPFYDYNDTVISAVKEVGFKLAFVGRAGTMGKATPKVTDLYKIPRMTVWDESLMSFNTWKSYL